MTGRKVNLFAGFLALCQLFAFGYAQDNPPVNETQVLTYEARSNDYTEFEIRVSDPDNEVLTVTFSVVSPIPGSTLAITERVSGSPVNFINRLAIRDAQLGSTIDVIVNVTDGTHTIEFVVLFVVVSLNHPPEVNVSIDGGSGRGTAFDPLPSPGTIPFQALTTDPDSLFAPKYHWTVVRQSGIFCGGHSEGNLFGANSSTGYLELGRLASSGTWLVSVTVTDGTHVAKASRLVYVASALIGCETYPGQAPTLVSLSTSLVNNTARPGQAFQAIVKGASTDPATFLIFASTTQFKPAVPIVSRDRSNCGAGCTVVTTIFAPHSGSAFFLWADVSNSTGTVERSLHVTISTSGGGGDPGGGGSCSEASWWIASCGTQVDAGCPTVTIIGGGTLELDGNIYNPIMDSVPTIRVDSTWQITSSDPPAGLSLHNSSSTHAQLITPEVNESTTVTLSLTGTVDSCTAVDSIEVQIEPVSAGADLKVTVPGEPLTADVGDDVSYTVTVSNLGPQNATSVILTHPVPDFLDYLSGISGLDFCREEGSNVTCSFDTLNNGSSRNINFKFKAIGNSDATVPLTVAGAQADPDSENNSASIKFDLNSKGDLVFPHSIENATPFPVTTFVGIAVYNPNNQPTDVEFIAFDANGQQVGAPVLLSELEQTLLQPNGQIARTAGDVFPGLEGVIALTARGVNGRVQGFFLLGNGVTSLDGVAGNLLESRKLYFPVARESENESTNLILYNTGVDQSADIELTLYDRSGDPLAIIRFDLAKQGTFMDLVRNAFDVDQVDGYILVESDIPVKGVEIYTNGEEISAIGAQESREVNRLIVPHFFFLDEDDTHLQILNVGGHPTFALVRAYDDAGTFLASNSVWINKKEIHSTRVSELLNLPSNVFTGYLVIDFEPDWSDDSALSSIIGMVTFSTGKAKTLASLPLLRTGSIHSKFLHIAQSHHFGLFTGLAILNSSSHPTDVMVKVFNTEGQIVREKLLSQVQPGTRVLKLLGEVLEDPSFEALGGHFEIESSHPVMVFALFGDWGQRYLAAIEGQD